MTFSSEKNYVRSGVEKCPPYYIQTMEQTVDGTDKTQIFYVPRLDGTPIFQKCPPPKLFHLAG